MEEQLVYVIKNDGKPVGKSKVITETVHWFAHLFLMHGCHVELGGEGGAGRVVQILASNLTAVI